MKRLIAFRLYLVVEAAQAIDLSLFEPQSRVYALLQAGGNVAFAGAVIMSILTGAAAFDLVVGEFGPQIAERVRFLRWGGERLALYTLLVSQFLRKWRSHIWWAMFVGYAAQVWIAAHYSFAPRIALLYVRCAIGCAAAAWLDNHYRFKATKQYLKDTGHGELT